MRKTMKFKVASIGELLWDIFPNGKRLGGAPANFSYHIQSFGADAYLISSVGTDPLGIEIRQKLKKSGLTDIYVSEDMVHSTGTVMVSIDKSGQPEYIITKNVAYDYIPFNQRYVELAGCVDAVYFGTLAQRSEVSALTIKKFLSTISKSVPIVLDINLRLSCYNRSIIEQSLSLCTVLKLNEFELNVISKMMSIGGDRREIISKLINMFNLDLIALTRGECGSVIYTCEREYVHQGFPVKVCNTVGAGDAFTAALVMGILRGDGIEKISEDANRVASKVCQMEGASTAE